MKWLNAFIAWVIVGLAHHGYIHWLVAVGLSIFYLGTLGLVRWYFDNCIPKKDD